MYVKQPGLLVASANAPIVGYENFVTSSIVSTTTQNSLYPRSNLANHSTHLVWKGTSSVADEDIVLTFSGGQELDYIAIAEHNFGTEAISVAVSGATDGVPTYATLATGILQSDDAPLLVRFAKATYTHIRIRLSPGSGPPQAAVVYAGRIMELPRNIYVGHTPITLGKRNRIVVGRSESGAFLGRVTTGQGNETSVAMKNLEPAWYRNFMKPFTDAAESSPFFFGWRPGTYPDEIGYAWLTSDPIPVNERSNGMMSVELQMSGVV